MTTAHSAAILTAERIQQTIESVERAVEDLRTTERTIWQALQNNRTAQTVLIDRRTALNADLEHVYTEIKFYTSVKSDCLPPTDICPYHAAGYTGQPVLRSFVCPKCI